MHPGRAGPATGAVPGGADVRADRCHSMCQRDPARRGGCLVGVRGRDGQRGLQPNHGDSRRRFGCLPGGAPRGGGVSDGLVHLQADGGPFSAVLSGPDGSVTISTLSDEGVTLPPAFGVGDSWEQATLLSISSAEVSGQATLSYEFEVIQTETITVPAGTFQALRVEVAGEIESPLSGATVGYERPEGVAPGVGLVRYEGHMPEGGDLSAVTYELTAYSIP